jgi:hypothetical protein
MRSGRKRRSGYPDDYIRYAERLYEVEGLAPSAIHNKLAEERPKDDLVPYDTLKGWLRGKTRGAGRDDPSQPKWDFTKASRADRELIAPLFAAKHLRMTGPVEPDGRNFELDPSFIWPSQDVGKWFISLRALVPDEPVDETWTQARHIAMYERRIAGGDGDGTEADSIRDLVAAYLELAGRRSLVARAMLEATAATLMPQEMSFEVDPETK